MISKKRPHVEDSTDSGEASVKKSRADRSDPTITKDMQGLWYRLGSNWTVLDDIKKLVVFGDSSTRLGSVTTWLGYFMRSLKVRQSGIQAYCYAAPGNTVEDDMVDQLCAFFEQFPAKSNSKAQPSLDPGSTLYVVWLGINDCGRLEPDDLEEIIEKLFEDGLEELYMKASARKFLLLDVPPKDRSPSGLALQDTLSTRYQRWNDELLSRTMSFTSENKHVSLFLFSSYEVVTNILDNPEEYGFQEDDVMQESGAIWADELHFTTDVHAILAERIEQVLRTVDRDGRSTGVQPFEHT